METKKKYYKNTRNFANYRDTLKYWLYLSLLSFIDTVNKTQFEIVNSEDKDQTAKKRFDFESSCWIALVNLISFTSNICLIFFLGNVSILIKYINSGSGIVQRLIWDYTFAEVAIGA